MISTPFLSTGAQR
ncbi:unnamed protein product [Oppiella nova]|uniref:Uncharacterized protein n=1 Tax=Oppiella nova TaxID=334625 RepID=A0A7R9MM78_9ACAR|nr:unnamed protein product [Oppiella nova]CAG2180007.1 unnamed protein product [Oppiella nova]